MFISNAVAGRKEEEDIESFVLITPSPRRKMFWGIMEV